MTRPLPDRVEEYLRVNNQSVDDVEVPSLAGELDANPAEVSSILTEIEGEEAGDGGDGANPQTDENAPSEAGECGLADCEGCLSDDASYSEIFKRAQEYREREYWEYVTEEELRAALSEAGHEELLENGVLGKMSDWRAVDFSDQDEDEHDWRWFYVPAGGDPKPEQFRLFHDLLTAAAPDDYEPYYFRVEQAGKAPATQYGSWKEEVNRLNVEEAVEHMEAGGNVGIAGRPDDPLVNIDVDDGEVTTPEDLPETLRARSRSRTGWHAWAFDPADEIPNMPTDDLGEIRTDWQYVVAPGSFVPAAREEIPEGCENVGYYTIDEEAPVATIGYEDLPESFREWEEQKEEETHDTPPVQSEDSDDLTGDDSTTPSSGSAVFDVRAEDVVRREGGDTDTSQRWTAIFHGSSTSANMSLSDKGRIQCWRHNVAHGGLQALAALSKHSPGGDSACRQLGTGHKHSNAGTCKYKSDWRLVWWAWEAAKDGGYIPDDDPIPYTALLNLAVRDGVVDREDLVERDSDDGGTYLGFPDAEAYNAALAHVEEEYNRNPGREEATTGDRGGEYYPVVECEPPAVDRETAAIEDLRDDLAGERYDAFVDADHPAIWGDDPGTGKTTTAALAADDRDHDHVVLFQDHEKAREFITDPVTPDGYYHLKGGPQKRDDECMDADHADVDCPTHGHNSNCPAMCPVYHLAEDHETRQAYEVLKEELGPVQAHVILSEDLHSDAGHDEDGSCEWLAQFNDIENESKIVGVHEYQLLKSVRKGRDVIIDEHPGPDSVASERTLKVDQLTRMANKLETLSNLPLDDPEYDLMGEFAAFTREVIDVITSTGGADSISDIEPPDVDTHAKTVAVEVDPEDLPDWADPEDVEEQKRREDRGMPGEGYEERTAHVVERTLVDEVLAQAKIAYHESLLRHIRDDAKEWSGAPFAFDALLAAAIEAGLDPEAGRRAIAVPSLLDYCPRCGSDFDVHNGERVCPACAWAESESYLTSPDQDGQRAIAWLAEHQDRTVGLTARKLPLPEDLPEAPLVLNATPSVEEVAYLYDSPIEDVELYGDEPLAVDELQLTQVVDGQYHWSTINQTPSLRERIEDTVSKLNRVHDDLLVIGRKAARKALDLPDDVGWLHYHAARGKNRAEYDAVICLGAPHPNVTDLQRDARILCQGQNGRVGGAEHSTRRDAPNPPVYRKLEYADEDGRGRAVPTKHYTGVTGALFRQAREQELEQAVHRIRPLLADHAKHAYLLTNVPTRLPVDEVCDFEQLAQPLEALLPVPEGGLRLVEYIRDVVAGDGPDGFREETLIRARDDGEIEMHVDELHRLAQLNGEDVCEKTVRRWVDSLVEIGLLEPGVYKQFEGVPFSADQATLTSALSVVSNNASVEVGVQRRLRRLIEESDSALEWLTKARQVLNVGPDRCTVGAGSSAAAPPG